MCGESPAWLSPVAVREGSPPHVWGKLRDKIGLPGRGGITPTCVGKASMAILPLMPMKDHPHMCGESCKAQSTSPQRQGSPPHVWGKPVYWDEVTNTDRITPTCVGKARYILQESNLIKDHPHMCGESFSCFHD